MEAELFIQNHMLAAENFRKSKSDAKKPPIVPKQRVSVFKDNLDMSFLDDISTEKEVSTHEPTQKLRKIPIPTKAGDTRSPQKKLTKFSTIQKIARTEKREKRAKVQQRRAMLTKQHSVYPDIFMKSFDDDNESSESVDFPTLNFYELS